jgi:protocatechuate 3,4-dioxygenase beta subunit
MGASAGMLSPLFAFKPLQPFVCPPTTPDIIGPFYLANAPTSAQLSSASEPGTPLFISGTVQSENCPTAIPNALVEVWHATDGGAYYSNVNAFSLRGRIYTGTNGEYSFTTILPGWYLNGAQFRPRHVHFQVSAPGYTSLVTQLYFTGDPYIAADPWASQPAAAARIIPLVNNGGTMEGTFDIMLNDPTLGVKSPYSEKGVLMNNHPNPFSESTNLYFNVFNYSSVQLSVYDSRGIKVKNLVEQKFIPGRYQAFWDGTNSNGSRLPAGIYITRLNVDGERVGEMRMILS